MSVDTKTLLACLGYVAEDALEILKEAGLKRIAITADAIGGSPYWDVTAIDHDGCCMTLHAFQDGDPNGFA